MVKIAKYRPKGGVTTDDVPEGEHKAVIKDTDTVTLQRAKLVWDKKVGTARSQDFEHEDKSSSSRFQTKIMVK